MKIKDITEGWGNVVKGMAKDFVGSQNVAGTQNWLDKRATAAAISKDAETSSLAQRMARAKQTPDNNDPTATGAGPSASAKPTSPESDISKLVPDGMQFKFQNPDLPGSFIIIRQDGYWQDRIPRNLAGQVKKVNGLYPVLRPENIRKFNSYYNNAADNGRVREEPLHAL